MPAGVPTKRASPSGANLQRAWTQYCLKPHAVRKPGEPLPGNIVCCADPAARRTI